MTVDGATQPERIPIATAYYHFFDVVGPVPADQLSPEADLKRRKAYMATYFHQRCGAGGSVDRSLTQEQLTKFFTFTGAIKTKMKELTETANRLDGPGREQAAKAVEQYVLSAADQIAIEVDPDAASKVAHHVREDVRRKITITRLELQHHPGEVQ